MSGAEINTGRKSSGIPSDAVIVFDSRDGLRVAVDRRGIMRTLLRRPVRLFIKDEGRDDWGISLRGVDGIVVTRSNGDELVLLRKEGQGIYNAEGSEPQHFLLPPRS